MGLTKSLGEEKTKQVYQSLSELGQINSKSKKLEEYYEQIQKGEKVEEKILGDLIKQIATHNENLQIAEK